MTKEEAADLVAFSLAIADGLTEEDVRLRDSDLYRRVQARALTQAEMTRDRLNQLLHRPATRVRPLSAVAPGERSGTGPISAPWTYEAGRRSSLMGTHLL